MTNKLEGEKIKIDQGRFKRLYDSAIVEIPDRFRRQGIKKSNSDYNKILKTNIELFLSKNGLIKTILDEPEGDAKVLFVSIFNCLKAEDEHDPITYNPNPAKNRQKNLFDAT